MRGPIFCLPWSWWRRGSKDHCAGGPQRTTRPSPEPGRRTERGNERKGVHSSVIVGPDGNRGKGPLLPHPPLKGPVLGVTTDYFFPFPSSVPSPPPPQHHPFPLPTIHVGVMSIFGDTKVWHLKSAKPIMSAPQGDPKPAMYPPFLSFAKH